MSVVPKPDLQIYDPANIDNIVSARLHSKFVGFYCSDRRVLYVYGVLLI